MKESKRELEIALEMFIDNINKINLPLPEQIKMVVYHIF